ncbi:hypothetical protein WMO41_11250 [Ventrimonas sp. CLA-AP-H27]|uniref:DUF4282 domain-containing protein n=1 Tax=Ventrimonas faecis TaxID=3133170 RepID=A0ABV1HNT3_9FIRM
MINLTMVLLLLLNMFFHRELTSAMKAMCHAVLNDSWAEFRILKLRVLRLTQLTGYLSIGLLLFGQLATVGLALWYQASPVKDESIMEIIAVCCPMAIGLVSRFLFSVMNDIRTEELAPLKRSLNEMLSK